MLIDGDRRKCRPQFVNDGPRNTFRHREPQDGYPHQQHRTLPQCHYGWSWYMQGWKIWKILVKFQRNIRCCWKLIWYFNGKIHYVEFLLIFPDISGFPQIFQCGSQPAVKPQKFPHLAKTWTPGPPHPSAQ